MLSSIIVLALSAFAAGQSSLSDCPEGTSWDGLECSTTNSTTTRCEPNQYLNIDGKCWDYNYNTTTRCGPNQYLNADGKCWDYNYNTTTRCEPNQYLNADGKCWDYNYNYNTTIICEPNQYLNSDQRCVDFNSTACPMGTYMNEKRECIYYNYTYTNPCGYDQYYYNNTCIPACKRGEFLDMNGRCVSPQKMCEKSLPGAVFDPKTYKCECPMDHWMIRNNSFVPPVVCAPVPHDTPQPYPRIACQSFIPYTIYDFTLDTCLCDKEHPVIVPNPKDPFVSYTCELPGTLSSIKSCILPEFFDFIDGKCILPKDDSTNPTYTPIPTSTIRPSFTPYPTTTSRPSYIEKPSESASRTPFVTQFPSRKPSTTPTSTRTPKPSERPNSVTSTTSASRTPRPSAAIFADISRKPLPSIIPLPPPPSVAKSPAPSRWARPSALAQLIDRILPEERPPYIDSRLSFAGANVTEMSKPEKIQQMQASLACTLRMPLENIRIRNITYTDPVTGKVKQVDVDPSSFMMMGDGSTDCYKMGSSTNQTRRMLRQNRVLGTTASSVNIDYSIVEPSNDILILDTRSLNQVLTTSPVMIEAASSVGGTSMSVTNVEAQAVTAPVPSSSSAPVTGSVTNSQGVGSTIDSFKAYVGGGIGAFVAITIITILSIFYVKEKKRSKRLLKQQAEEKAKSKENKQIIVQFSYDDKKVQNPMATLQMTNQMRAESTRFDYTPETARRSLVGPLKTTHQHILTGTGV